MPGSQPSRPDNDDEFDQDNDFDQNHDDDFDQDNDDDFDQDNGDMIVIIFISRIILERSPILLLIYSHVASTTRSTHQETLSWR